MYSYFSPKSLQRPPHGGPRARPGPRLACAHLQMERGDALVARPEPGVLPRARAVAASPKAQGLRREGGPHEDVPGGWGMEARVPLGSTAQAATSSPCLLPVTWVHLDHPNTLTPRRALVTVPAPGLTGGRWGSPSSLGEGRDPEDAPVSENEDKLPCLPPWWVWGHLGYCRKVPKGGLQPGRRRGRPTHWDTGSIPRGAHGKSLLVALPTGRPGPRPPGCAVPVLPLPCSPDKVLPAALPRVHTAGPSHSQQRTQTTRTRFTKKKFKHPTKSHARASARSQRNANDSKKAPRVPAARQTSGTPGGCLQPPEWAAPTGLDTDDAFFEPEAPSKGETVLQNGLHLQKPKRVQRAPHHLRSSGERRSGQEGEDSPQRAEAGTSRRRAETERQPRAAGPEGERPRVAQGGARPRGAGGGSRRAANTGTVRTQTLSQDTRATKSKMRRGHALSIGDVFYRLSRTRRHEP